MNLTLTAGMIADIVSHAQHEYPLEACGILVGNGLNGIRFLAAQNILASQTAYEMSPAWLASTFRQLRQDGHELVAIVHSHPAGPAQPSTLDVSRAYYPDAAHIIVSLADRDCPAVRGFRIIASEPIEIELHVIV